MKYRVEVMGIVNALTGNPSTPWHITVGNPLRPVFCSGDMLTTEVNLKLGPILAFNDLPSSIIVEFTLTNARNWGMQEIMAKFNSGYLRTVDVQKTFFETTVNFEKGQVKSAEPVGVMPGEYLYTPEPTGSAGTSGTSGTLNQGGNPKDGVPGSSGSSGTQGTGGVDAKKDTATIPNNTVPGSGNGIQGTQGTLTSPDQTKLVGGKK
jgi:hypothetical protein